MKAQSYIIFAFIFALVIAVFAVINVDAVQVNYLFGTGEAPLILVILISVLLGGLATASVGAIRYFKLKRENRLLKHKLEDVDFNQETSSDDEVKKERKSNNDEQTTSEVK